MSFCLVRHFVCQTNYPRIRFQSPQAYVVGVVHRSWFSEKNGQVTVQVRRGRRIRYIPQRRLGKSQRWFPWFCNRLCSISLHISIHISVWVIFNHIYIIHIHIHIHIHIYIFVVYKERGVFFIVRSCGEHRHSSTMAGSRLASAAG